jgi:acyl-CoA synthetase (AMP-forming)/AMP-acid ligase II
LTAAPAAARPREERPLTAVPTVGDLLLGAAADAGDADALVFPGERSSFAELADRAVATARSLRALGVERGDHVGILMPNCPEFMDVFFGAALLGAVSVTLNARYRSAELAYAVENAELKVLATTDRASEYADFVSRLGEALPGLAEAPNPRRLSPAEAPLLRSVVMLGGSEPPGLLSRDAFAALRDEVSAEEVALAAERVRVRDQALMMYTSGTTAHPKGCPLTHEALTRVGVASAIRFRLTPADRIWNPLPMFHMAAMLPLLAALHVRIAFLSTLHFEAGEALREIEQERATILYPTFPALTQALVLDPGFAAADLSSVRVIVNVAPPDVQRAVQRSFPQAVHVASYGCTELGGVCVYTELDDTDEQRATLSGRPLLGCEIRVVDPDTGEPLPPGEPGELVGRGVTMFDGYWRDPERTAEAIDEAGWFHTGDRGVVDADGRVAYLGRLKDMLKVGGENVAALELESFLSTHPAVKIAQVVGVPDPRLDEVPAAFVELVPGASATEDEVIGYCRGAIASFKVPRYVRFVDEWPMSATKIQKTRLRDQLLEELGAGS